MIKRLFILFLFVTINGYTQSVYKDAGKISDSTDYYLEIGLFNKEAKKSYTKAILYTEKAIEYAKNNKLDKKLADGYLQLATIFYELEKNDLAIDYYIRAISIFSKSEPNSNIALSYYGLGKCYLKKNNISNAEIYFEKATVIYKKLNFLEAIELINLQKAIIKKEKGKIDEASNILKGVIENISDDALLSTKTEAYIQLGEIEILKKNYPQAINYLNLANQTNEANNNDYQLTKRIYKLLSTTYEKNKNLSSSNFYLKKYAYLTDSIGKYYNNYVAENTVDKIQFDKQLKTILESEVLDISSEQKSPSCQLIESGNQLYLHISGKEIQVFDLFGNRLKRLPLKTPAFDIVGDQILLVFSDKIQLWKDWVTPEETLFQSSDAGIREACYTRNKLLIMTDNKVLLIGL